jgi:ATP adenylyltransferase
MKQLWAPWRLEYIQGPQSDGCVFCLGEDRSNDAGRLVVARSECAFVMLNRYPYSNGHLLISPCRHLCDPDQLERDEVLEIHELMVRCQQVLREVCAAQGFNVGWNIGEVAGAGIASHIHMHVVPRWAGDANFMPVLADTRVIPQHLERTCELLREAFATS